MNIKVQLLHVFSLMLKLIIIWFCPKRYTFVQVSVVHETILPLFNKPALLRTSQWITNKTLSYSKKFSKSAWLLMTCKVKQFLHRSDSDAC